MIHIREIKMLFLSPTFICFTSWYSSVQRCSKANCLRDIKPWYYYVTLPQILLHFSILSSPIHAIVQTPVDDNVNLLCSVGHSYFDLLHVKDSSIAISAQNIAGKKGDWQKITYLKPGGKRHLATWETSCHCGHWDVFRLVPGWNLCFQFRTRLLGLDLLSASTHSATLFG